jgi:hypothetical protein
LDLPRCKIDVCCEGGAVTSDAVVLLLRQVDGRLGPLKAVARMLLDARQPCLITLPKKQLPRR